MKKELHQFHHLTEKEKRHLKTDDSAIDKFTLLSSEPGAEGKVLAVVENMPGCGRCTAIFVVGCERSRILERSSQQTFHGRVMSQDFIIP